jgi:hypothetical protein
MPGQIRQSKKAAKIAYKVLKTPKKRQQSNRPPDRRLLLAWFKDSFMSQ